MRTYVYSTVDLYGGDVKSGKLYPLISDHEFGFDFMDDSGFTIFGSWSGSTHHSNNGGEWVKVTDYDAHEGEADKMNDEQWSEWIEWGGGDDPPIDDGVRFDVEFRDRTFASCNQASLFEWGHEGDGCMDEIVRYRYFVQDARPYDAYTTDELVHAVRNMRSEIRRRCGV